MIRQGPPPPSLRWRSWPLRDEPLRASLVVLGLVAAGAILITCGVAAHMALLAVLALAITLWRIFVPVAFELNADGVNQTLLGQRRQLPWSAVRRYEVNAAGVLLLPHADRCSMDFFRGLYLPWNRHREELLTQIRYHLGETIDA